MSETPTPAAEDGAAEGAEMPVAATEPAPEGNDPDPQEQKLSDEAAKWRRQARAEETYRRLAEAHVDKLQREQIRQHLAHKLAAPDDFWIARPEVTVADLMNDDGDVDADKVHAAAEEILAERPFWKATLKPVGAPASSVQGDGKYNVPGSNDKVDWSDVLRGKTAG